MIHLGSIFSYPFLNNFQILAEVAHAETAPMVLAGVLLSLIFIYLASKLGGELSKLVDLPPSIG